MRNRNVPPPLVSHNPEAPSDSSSSSRKSSSYKKSEIELNKNQVYKETIEVFKLIFEVLAAMVVDNSKSQALMLKYIESFIMPELGSMEQVGELDLVLTCINDSNPAIENSKNVWTLSKTQ